MRTNISRMLVAVLIVTLLSIGVIAIGVSAEDTESLYITAVNTKVTAGSGTVFTKDFNGTDTIKSDPDGGGNFRWVTLFTCKPTNVESVFEVTSFQENLADDLEVVIPEGGFIYAAHHDDSNSAWMKEKSEVNMEIIKKVNIGEYVTIINVDLENSIFYKGAALYLGNVTEEEVETPDVSKVDSEESDESSQIEESSVPEDDSEPAEDKSEDDKPGEDTADDSKDQASTPSKDEDEGMSTPLIIGIVAGVLVLIGVVVLVIKKSKKQH